MAEVGSEAHSPVAEVGSEAHSPVAEVGSEAHSPVAEVGSEAHSPVPEAHRPHYCWVSPTRLPLLPPHMVAGCCCSEMRSPRLYGPVCLAGFSLHGSIFNTAHTSLGHILTMSLMFYPFQTWLSVLTQSVYCVLSVGSVPAACFL